MSDFRIAPLLMLIFLTLYQIFHCYRFFIVQEDFQLKPIIISIIALLLAFGAFRSHHFLSKQYKIVFYSLLVLNLLGIIHMIYQMYS